MSSCPIKGLKGDEEEEEGDKPKALTNWDYFYP